MVIEAERAPRASLSVPAQSRALAYPAGRLHLPVRHEQWPVCTIGGPCRKAVIDDSMHAGHKNGCVDEIASLRLAC